MMESCAAENRRHFHRDAIAGYLQQGGRIGIYMHDGYAAAITTVADISGQIWTCSTPTSAPAMFPPDRPVRTKNHEEVSTYYGEEAKRLQQSCGRRLHHRGHSANSILFSDVSVERGAKLDGCIVMRGGVVRENAQLKYVIADKYAELSPYITLTGSPNGCP
jgi:glucose-1-phosphate adenylyltransferase